MLNRIIKMVINPKGQTMSTRSPLNLKLIKSEKNFEEFGIYKKNIWTVSKKFFLSEEPTSTEISIIRKEIIKKTKKKKKVIKK